MTRLADYTYRQGGDPKGRVAQFSPDGKQFVIVLRKGNLRKNTNEYSLVLYRTADVFHSPKPNLLVTMSSTSNRDAIGVVKWLANNETVVFLGENPGEEPQVYSFNIRARRLRKLTNHPTAIANYDITPDGLEILFLADPPQEKHEAKEKIYPQGIVIEGQRLTDLLAGDYSGNHLFGAEHLYLQRGEHAPTPIPIGTRYHLFDNSWMSLSPDGRYAAICAYARDIPEAWRKYRSWYMQEFFATNPPRGLIPQVEQALLWDRKESSIHVLIDAPAATNIFCRTEWAADAKSVAFQSYLPLEGIDPIEREARESSDYWVEVSLPSREFHKLAKDEWQGKETKANSSLEVSLEEDLNTPARIYVTDPKSQRKALLLDLNPQFSELDFGRVEIITWTTADEIELTGGLYLPPDYVPGKRYPLVIQTHGFTSKRFSMDGLNEWSSGFAARPLAGAGIVALQLYRLKDEEQYKRNEKKLGGTPEQARVVMEKRAYEAAVDALAERGLIDRDRVGIVGFSRSVCFVAYTLTHSKYSFAAASLVDGVDCGYFQEIAFPDAAWDINKMNGGVAPYGEGLQQWWKESPGFNLDKVHTPVRLLSLARERVPASWEWYVGLSFQKKPVDFVFLPDADHFVNKPWERVVAQQGLVDWFRFWLKGEEDPEVAKNGQYARWRSLRVLQKER
jgi:dipeptidyl aminopeptidase/acylaminoacyl peptidase